MNVWLMPSAFHPHKGGVEELTLQIGLELRRSGHDVLVITNRHPPDLGATDAIDGIRVIRRVFPSPRVAIGPAVQFPAAFARSVRDLLAQTPAPDVIHVQCASAQLATGAAVARLRRVPLIVTTQGEVVGDANNIFQESAYMRSVLRIASRAATTLTACSRVAAEGAALVAPRFRQATVVPNGVSPNEWTLTPVPDEPVVAAWGRHVRGKGFDLLLSAWPLVREAFPSARLLLGGTGPDTPALEAAAGEGTEFLGELDRQGVQQLLDRSRVVVVPSRVEAFGIVALEAMASGRPVVWSSLGGLADATGGLGWAVNPHDPVELANAIVSALRSEPDPMLYRQHAESLSWAEITNRYVGLYSEPPPLRPLR